MKKLLLIGILLTLIGCSKDYSEINTGVEGVKYEFTYDNGKDNIEVTKSVYGCLKNCEVVVEFELQNLLDKPKSYYANWALEDGRGIIYYPKNFPYIYDQSPFVSISYNADFDVPDGTDFTTLRFGYYINGKFKYKIKLKPEDIFHKL